MSGLSWEAFSFKDVSFEKAFGPASGGPIVALGRDISGIPIVCQGTENTCVACAVTWIEQFLEKDKPDLSHEWLASISHTGPNGAKPSQVLEPARKTGILSQYLWDSGATGDCLDDASKHRVPGYAYLEDLTPQGLYNGLKRGPLMIGVDDWMGMGPHMMVAYDVTDDGSALKAVSWGNPSIQEEVVVMFKAVELAIFVGELPVSLGKDQLRLPMLSVLKDKLSSLSLKKIFAGIGVVIAALTGGVAAQKQFGAAGVASGYRTTLSASITASQPYFTVSSITLTSGETLSTSTLRLGEGMPVYLKINPGGATEELVECYGLSTRTWNMCSRSIGYLGTGTTSTVASRAFGHAAGETVIVANDAPFYNRFVDTYTNQSVTGTKTFLNSQIRIGDGATTAQYIYFMNGQTNAPYFKTLKGSTSSTIYYSLDGTSELELNSGGTTFGASSTKATFLTNGLIGFNNSSTGGIANDSVTGAGYVNVSSTASDNGGFLKYTFNTANQIYWDIISFLSRSNIWSGTSSTFTGAVNFSGNVTSTGTLRVTTPVADLDATPKSYVDTGLQFLNATGTAGATVTAGRALYLNTSGQLLHTNTSAVSTTFAYVGVAVTGGTVGQTISYTREGGINCAQSGLSASVDYYLNGTAGQISGTPASNLAQIGKALSATCIHLVSPKFRVAGSTTISSNGGLYFATGFYPRVVSIQASGSGSESMSLGDQNNNSTYAYRGTGPPTGNFGVSGVVYTTYNTAANATSRSGTILLDPSGFTITTTNGAAPQNVSITWYATN